MSEVLYKCDVCGTFVLNTMIRSVCTNCNSSSKYIKLGINQSYFCQ